METASQIDSCALPVELIDERALIDALHPVIMADTEYIPRNYLP